MSLLSFLSMHEKTNQDIITELYIDVREPSERSQWHLQWSINIPLWDIQKWEYNLSKEKRIGVYCRSGSRSSMAMQILKQQWYNIYNAWWIIYGIDNIPIVT